MNIFDGIERQARDRPGAPAIIDGERVLGFARLEAASRTTCGILSEAGIAPGDVVALEIGGSPLHLLLTLSLARMGAVSVYVAPNSALAAKKALLERFAVKAVVAERSTAAAEGRRLLVAEPAWLWAPASPRDPRAASVPADERPWRILLTSGTTGASKGIAQRHAAFARACALRAGIMGADSRSRFLCRMPLFNMPVLTRAVTHLLAGGAVVFPQGDLADVFDAIERHAVTHAYASPVMLARWLRAYPENRSTLASLVYLNVGGGRLPPELARAAMARMTPNVFVSYGSTETGAIACADPDTLRREPRTVGRVVPWAEVEVVDDLDRPLPRGETGLLRVRGEEVAKSYYGGGVDARGTAKAFRDGWFYSGDRGRLSLEGLLYVEGRSDDVINMGGPKINAQAIEDILAAHASVMEAAVFGVTASDGMPRLVAAVVPRGRFDKRALMLHLKARGGLRYPPLIVPVRALPRNAMGKVLKRELARRISIKPRAAAPAQQTNQ